MALNRSFLSLVDANSNRAKEGLRVVEDIARFVLRDKRSTLAAKQMRHNITSAVRILSPKYTDLLHSRDSASDKGRRLNPASEFRKKGISGLLASNFKRVQESLRVLEEIAKISGPGISVAFKELRYESYVLEKKLLLKHG